MTHTEAGNTKTPQRKRFLIGQLGCFGDCLYATTVARQIKNDFPDCHLTWAIGSRYQSILNGNPYIDAIWEYPLSAGDDMAVRWQQFENEAIERKNKGDFDEIFLTQLYPNNFRNFDGTVRSSIFRGYTRPITVPMAPVLCLSDAEVENARHFAETHALRNKEQVILFECAPSSGQSFVTPAFAHEVSKKIIEKHPKCCIILSSNRPFLSDHVQIIDGSVLSFRENAEITKYCTLLIGCSGGISWLCTSDWAKPLPMIQLLKKEDGAYASVVRDHEYNGLETHSIIEMTDCPAETISTCIQAIFNEGFESARQKYHQRIKANSIFYLRIVYIYLLKKGRYRDAVLSMGYFIKRWFLI
ncbi:MAG: hypothetical protein ABSG28_03080 [Methanoregula sp.]|jgi:hypothetical protein|uniref:glycosyltransferase family 9 protein n=1 Tax=Methanoregula sp. TaxID=2052170 RepID=UPI003C21B311